LEPCNYPIAGATSSKDVVDIERLGIRRCHDEKPGKLVLIATKHKITTVANFTEARLSQT
jgi:hypothetical protein